MRIYRHVLQKSKSGKSILFRIYVSDVFGEQKFNYASLSGWRAELAEKHLLFDHDDWNDDIARKFVGIMALKIAHDRYQGTQFLNRVKQESDMEIHFWAYQFLRNPKAPGAWKMLNGDAQ
ncbi:MAG: hypothetical protein OXI27_01940 [Thaumarchaeota archaeon]|nr:hypothetical protein [Nitrososphaerota archaeon]